MRIVSVAAVMFFSGVAAEARPASDASSAEPDATLYREKTQLEAELAEEGFEWRPALRQSFCFLGVEHGFRMTQAKTRRGLRGPFFKDWAASVKNIGGWGDGDPAFTNLVAHPMQGTVAGYIQVQNDPQGREQEFGRSRGYWRSRMKALAWSAAYSTQFEIGPISEATLGNVGKKKGTAGWSDLIMTPFGGLGMMIGEDVLDRFVVRRLEARTSILARRRILRMVFNPNRSFTNLLRRKAPWHRDTRGLEDFLAKADAGEESGKQPKIPSLNSPREHREEKKGLDTNRRRMLKYQILIWETQVSSRSRARSRGGCVVVVPRPLAAYAPGS